MTERNRKDTRFGLPFWRRDNGIWYTDLRQLGGPSRKSLGTRDKDDAEDELSELKDEWQERAELDGGDPELKTFVDRHLRHREGEVAPSTWDNEERALGYLCAYLDRVLSRTPRVSDVTAKRLREFLEWRTETVKASTAGVELTGISTMLERAVSWKIVSRNEAQLVSRPKVEPGEANHLEPGEAARVLETARKMETDPASRCYDHLHALLATFLYTGGRKKEVLGLERRDVKLKAGEVKIRPNDWRSLKNRWSQRKVPLWSELEKILRPYMERREDDHPLLFPNRDGEMLDTLRWSLSTVEDKTKKLDTHLTLKVFRHTYASVRVQTLDGGEPISTWQVARELGHKSTKQVEERYAHLLETPHRHPDVRYGEADVTRIEEARSG